MGQPQGDNGTLPVSIAPQNVTAGPGLSLRHAGTVWASDRADPVGRDGYEVDAMIGAPA